MLLCKYTTHLMACKEDTFNTHQTDTYVTYLSIMLWMVKHRAVAGLASCDMEMNVTRGIGVLTMNIATDRRLRDGRCTEP